MEINKYLWLIYLTIGVLTPFVIISFIYFLFKTFSKIEKTKIKTIKDKKKNKFNILVFFLIIILFLGGYVAYTKISSLEASLEETQKEKQQKESEIQKIKFELTSKQQEVEAERLRQEELNSDNDHDGLTLREELELGTDPENIDTDGDGIWDSFDTNPKGGGRYLVRVLNWNYVQAWSKTLQIHSDIFDYYKNWYTHHGSPTPKIAVTWINPQGPDYPIIKDLADYIKSSADNQGYNPVKMAVSLVQQLPYVADINTGYDSYVKFPIETLVDENGDCEDTAILASSILEVMGYDTVLLEYSKHIAIGVWCSDCTGSYYEFEGRKYYYYETTNPNWGLGQIPDEIKEEGQANVIQVNNQNSKSANSQ